MPTLTWLTRDDDIKAADKVPYRLLEAVPKLDGGGKSDRSENLLIQGDNLHALKALLPYYAGRVKCIFIDPPFNTGAAFEHYDDNLEHSQWLGMLYSRLEILRKLLAEDGVIWVYLDDHNSAYAKVMLDGIFGIPNYRNTITIKANSPFGFKHTGKNIFKSANSIFVYAKSSLAELGKVFVARDYDKQYKFFMQNPEEHYSKWEWCRMDQKVAEAMGFSSFREAKKLIQPDVLKSNILQFAINNADKVFRTASVTGGALKKRESTIKKSYEDKSKVYVHPSDDMDYFFLGGERILFYKDRLVNIDGRLWPGEVVTDLWTDISWEGIAKEGDVSFPKGKKPEKLIQRVLELSSNPGDLVLDSFLGSGTTAAVAHKMGRRWIGIELGEHAVTHCVPRLNAVIKGEQGGISKAVNWKGGGGFGFYKLGAEVFTTDGKINPDITFSTLAAHVWFCETKAPWSGTLQDAFLGVHGDTGYALLYNGVLGDRRVNGGNVLTHQTLDVIRKAAGKFSGPLVIYAAASRFGDNFLKRENIHFKQTPYEIEAW